MTLYHGKRGKKDAELSSKASTEGCREGAKKKTRGGSIKDQTRGVAAVTTVGTKSRRRVCFYRKRDQITKRISL